MSNMSNPFLRLSNGYSNKLAGKRTPPVTVHVPPLENSVVKSLFMAVLENPYMRQDCFFAADEYARQVDFGVNRQEKEDRSRCVIYISSTLTMVNESSINR
jgi:hypothetical protein